MIWFAVWPVKIPPGARLISSLNYACWAIMWQWTAQQIVEAFPFNESPRYLLRDRDGIYGDDFRQRVANMGLEEVAVWRLLGDERSVGA